MSTEQKTIFLSSSYSRRGETKRHVLELVEVGYIVASTWLIGEVPFSFDEDKLDECFATAKALAITNFEDLKEADTVICFAEPADSPNQRGNRHVEFGMAVGMGKRVILIGEPEIAFHCLPGIERYDTWEACLSALNEVAT